MIKKSWQMILLGLFLFLYPPHSDDLEVKLFYLRENIGVVFWEM
jgi:hypothetical protein